jgi:NADH-quinone oxidoreductase E subunit
MLKMEDIELDLQQIFSQYKNAERDSLIPVLQKIQEKFGYLPEKVIIEVGKFLNLPVSKIYGVATFYNQFRLEPVGKFHIMVCRGTACHVRGSKAVLDKIIQILKIEPGQTTRDGLFSLEVVACIGACGLAPVIAVNGKFHAKLTTDSVAKIINQYRRESNNEAKSE